MFCVLIGCTAILKTRAKRHDDAVLCVCSFAHPHPNLLCDLRSPLGKKMFNMTLFPVPPTTPPTPCVKQDFAQRRSQSAPLSITYGSTELVNAEEFFAQLMELGQKQG